MVSMKISQQENGRKQAEFLKNVAEFLRNWPNFITSLAGRPCCDLATVLLMVGVGQFGNILSGSGPGCDHFVFLFQRDSSFLF
jgi:hypothetical protein